jgi:hypothetical protein
MRGQSYSNKYYNTNKESFRGGETKVMKKKLNLLLVFALVLSLLTPAFAGAAALDTQAKYDALVEAGIFNGKGDAGAALQDDMTRAELAAILARVFNLDAKNDTVSYSDTANHWAHKNEGVIEAVTAAELMNGIGLGKFNPDGKVTLEQLAAVLVRGLGLEVDAEATVDAGVSAWAQAEVAAAVNAGLVPAGVADFTGNALRAVLVEGAFAAKTAIDAKAEVAAEAAAEAANLAKVDVASAEAVTNVLVKVTLEEAVEVVNASWFSIDDLEVVSAELVGEKTVHVTTEAQTVGELYTISANDTSFNFGGIAADTTAATVSSVSADYKEVTISFNEEVNAGDFTITEKYGDKASLAVTDVEFDGKNVILTTDAAKAALYEVSIKNVANLSGKITSDATRTFVGVTASDAKQTVSGATAINSTTVEVDFGSNVDQGTAVNAGSYTVTEKYGSKTTIEVVSAEMKLDALGRAIKDKVILTLASDMKASTLYTLDVADVTTSFGVALSSTGDSVSFVGQGPDTVKLDVTGVTAESNTLVKVQFNDDVDADVASDVANYSIVEKYGSKAALNVVSVKLKGNGLLDGANAYALLTVEAQKTVLYELKLSNITDEAGNVLVTGADTKTFVGTDVKPAIGATGATGLTATLDSDAVKLTLNFDVNVDSASAADVANYHIEGLGYPAKAARQLADYSKVDIYIPAQVDGKVYTVKVNNLVNIDGVDQAKERKANFVGKGAVSGLPQVEAVMALDKQTLKVYFDRDVTGSAINGRIWSSVSNTLVDNALEFKASNGAYSDLEDLVEHAYQGDEDNSLVVRFTTAAFASGSGYNSFFLKGATSLVKSTDGANVLEFAANDANPSKPEIIAVAAEDNKTITVYFSEGVSGVANTDFTIFTDAGITSGFGSNSGWTVSKVSATTYKIGLGTDTLASQSYYLVVGTLSDINDVTGAIDLKADGTTGAAATREVREFAGSSVAVSGISDIAVMMTDDRTMEVYFPEAMDATTATNVANYDVQTTAGVSVAAGKQPQLAVYTAATNKVTLYFQDDIGTDSKYNVVVSNSVTNSLGTKAVDDPATVAADDLTLEFADGTTAHSKPAISSVSTAADRMSLTITMDRAVAFGTLASTQEVSSGAAAINQFGKGTVTYADLDGSGSTNFLNAFAVTATMADGTALAAGDIANVERLGNTKVKVVLTNAVKLGSSGSVAVKTGGSLAINDKTNTAANTTVNETSSVTFGVSNETTFDTTDPAVLDGLGNGGADYSLAAETSASITFTEELSATSKAAVEAAILAGSDNDTLTFSWDGSKLTMTNTSTGTAVSFANDVTVDITDASGNNTAAGVVLIDSLE